MHEFWEELEEFIRPNFRGKITLHCDRGVVKSYETHQKRTPSSGTVDLMEEKRRNLTTDAE